VNHDIYICVKCAACWVDVSSSSDFNFIFSIVLTFSLLQNLECWSNVESVTFYPAFAWTLFKAIVNVDAKIPNFIAQKRIKRIPTGHDMESVSFYCLYSRLGSLFAHVRMSIYYLLLITTLLTCNNVYC
jgi:hypothetical protein